MTLHGAVAGIDTEHPAPARSAGDRTPMEKMLGLWVWNGQALCTFARLRIADVLARGGRTAQEIAAAIGAHEPTVYRLLGHWST